MDFHFLRQFEASHQTDLLALYHSAWWAESRTMDDVLHVLQHSDINIGIANGEGRLVAYLRVLSDYRFYATVYDVIVHVDYRSHGLGKMLMEAVLEHPDLQNVAYFELSCLPELEPFYEQWGFNKDFRGANYMRLSRKQTVNN